MFHLTTENLLNCPKEYGIYKIYAIADNGIAIPIPRFANTDNSGLLYIGETTKQNLMVRLTDFLQVSNLNLRTTNHSGALKYKRSEIIRNTLGLGHKLFYEYEQSLYPKKREKELLLQYAARFGEYPPLNG